MKTIYPPLAVGIILTLSLGACTSSPPEQAESATGATEKAELLTGELVGAGASSQAAAQDAWIAAFQTENPEVTINYDPTGSGAGRETFQQGGASFAGSDRAFTQEEIATGPFDVCAPGSGIVEIPAYISPIAIIFNIPGVEQLHLNADTIANIFSGQITRWNDAAITLHNPDVALPDASISAVHRSDKSGTTGNFTAYLNQAAPGSWSVGVVEEWPSDFGGEAAAGTSGVVQAVRDGVNTIGYADASRAEGLNTVRLQVGEDYVAYSAKAAAAIVATSPLAKDRTAGDLAVVLDYAATAGEVYPLVLVSYLIACQSYQNPNDAKLVHDYFASVVSVEGQELAARAAGSAPLSNELRDKVRDAIRLIG